MVFFKRSLGFDSVAPPRQFYLKSGARPQETQAVFPSQPRRRRFVDAQRICDESARDTTAAAGAAALLPRPRCARKRSVSRQEHGAEVRVLPLP